MKAELILENIGQYRGLKKYAINSGVITIFQGKNSLGKTTIIKAVGTALSSPIVSKNLMLEANKFGILPRDKKKRAPLVNYDENMAKIILIYDGENIEIIINKDGTIKTNFNGNEMFLYSGMLTKNSKILENLASGDYEFQWIVTEMSNASKYEDLKSIVDSYIELNNVVKATLEDINKKIGKNLSENEDLIEKKKNLEEDLLKVQEDMNNIDLPGREVYENLKSQENEKKAEIKGAENQLKKINDDIVKFDKDIKVMDDEISAKDDEINDIKNKMKENKEEIDRLKDLNENEINKEIHDYQKKLDPININLGKVLWGLSVWSNLKKNKQESNICPICESNIVITLKKIEQKINNLRKEEESYENKIYDINVEIKVLENKLKDKKEKIPLLKSQIDSHDKNIRDHAMEKDNLQEEKTRMVQKGKGQLLENKKDIEALIENMNSELEKVVGEKEDYEKRYEVLVPFVEKEKELTEEIAKIEGKIEKNNEEIETYKEITLFEEKIPIEKAEEVINKLSDEFDIIIDHIINKINEQRLGAAKKFNTTIKNVMKEIDLPNIENIFLETDNYNLKIIGKGGKPLPEGSLGGAEKATIGGILQVSCKQTYLRDFPFFIGDDLILDFDPENAEKFINYLKKLAKEEDLFVLITKPTSDKEIVQVELQ